MIDGGDVDLYVKFAEGSNRTEPGKTVYDYKSAGWSSVSEQVEVQWNMPHYCLDCVVYIAVYGYTKGSYSIQATSTGIATLQAGDSIGGTVRQGQYVYYSYYNQDSFAEMTISLTTVSSINVLFFLFQIWAY